MRTVGHVNPGAGIAVKCALAAMFVGSALWASVTTAGADVVPGTEDGWGAPPGGVTLSVVGDDGFGNHALTVTWGSIDPLPAYGGYWRCDVSERSTTTRSDDHGGKYTSDEPVVAVNFDVKLDPPAGGSFRRDIAEAPGERIELNIRCSTVYPGAFATTPPSPPFGWQFVYQLR